jgi:hypothetical protein
MSTNLDTTSWVNVDTLGAIYPFPGSEGILAVATLAFWVIWHIWQISSESKEFNADLRKIEAKGGIGKVLDDEARREMADLVGS